MIYGREALVLGAVLVGAILVGGQPDKQEWTLRTSGTPGTVHFTVTKVKAGNSWMWGEDVPAASLQSFTGRTGPVKFQYKQDAGSLLCEGRMFLGRGSGTWTFRPNPAFVSSLAQLGYAPPGDDQLFALLRSGVTLAFARGVQEAGLGASTSQLLELRNHGITLEYLRDTREAGYRDLSARDYVELKSHGIGADYLRDIRAAGYRFDAGDLVELRSRGVSAEFAADLKTAGYDLPAAKIAELRSRGVDSAFVRQLGRNGLHPAAGDLVQFRSRGVDPAYLKGLKDAGLEQLPAGEITELRSRGVNPPFIRTAGELGYRFSPRELIDLHAHGVDEEYLRHLQAAGMRNLTAEQIVKLRVHGVE